jgi:hypothetical protein
MKTADHMDSGPLKDIIDEPIAATDRFNTDYGQSVCQ